MQKCSIQKLHTVDLNATFNTVSLGDMAILREFFALSGLYAALQLAILSVLQALFHMLLHAPIFSIAQFCHESLFWYLITNVYEDVARLIYCTSGSSGPVKV